MKYIYCFLFIVMMILSLAACSLFLQTGTGSEQTIIDYYSKTVEYNTYIDPDEYYLEPAETRVYDEQGRLVLIFIYHYEPYDPDGFYWLNTRTDVYDVDSAGGRTLTEYYTYEYLEDYYTYFDAEGNEIEVTEFLIEHAKTYSPEDEVLKYYDVIYDQDPAHPDRYRSITDWMLSGSGSFVNVGLQLCTYMIVNPGAPAEDQFYDYRTEKYYDTTPDENDLSLSAEYACWYDENDGRWLYELFHTIRSSETGVDEFYYYTLFSWDENDNVYMQSDFDYDNSDVPVLGDGSYDDSGAGTTGPLGPFIYSVTHENIGPLEETLITEYDDVGNIISDKRMTGGIIKEYITYSYNEFSEQTDMCRYVDNASQLYERISTRFREEYLQGVYYRIKEECIYRFYDEETENSARTINCRNIGGTLSGLKNSIYKKVSHQHIR